MIHERHFPQKPGKVSGSDWNRLRECLVSALEALSDTPWGMTPDLIAACHKDLESAHGITQRLTAEQMRKDFAFEPAME